MNPLDAREADETYEYPARPYTLPMRPVQTFKVLSESGDVPAAQQTDWTQEDSDDFFFPDDRAWSDWYLTAEDARVLRQDGM